MIFRDLRGRRLGSSRPSITTLPTACGIRPATARRTVDYSVSRLAPEGDWGMETHPLNDIDGQARAARDSGSALRWMSSEQLLDLRDESDRLFEIRHVRRRNALRALRPTGGSARVSRARPIWGVPTLSCGAYSGVALNGSITRPKSAGDRAYHERRLTTREIAFGAVSRRRRRRHSAANWRAWAEVAGPGRDIVIARLVLADGQ
jgi:hypothetical protein